MKQPLDPLSALRALELWVPVPRTEILTEEVRISTWPVPVIVKAGRHGLAAAPRLVIDAEHLARLPRDGRFLLQEYLPGEEHALDLLVTAGEVRGLAQHRVARFGALVPDQVDFVLEMLARRTVEVLGLEGAPRLRFKRDRFGVARLFGVEEELPLRAAA